MKAFLESSERLKKEMEIYCMWQELYAIANSQPTRTFMSYKEDADSIRVKSEIAGDNPGIVFETLNNNLRQDFINHPNAASAMEHFKKKYRINPDEAVAA